MKKWQAFICSLIFAIAAVTIVRVLVHVIAQPPKVHAASTYAPVACDSFKPISITSNTQIVTGGANEFVYICSITFGSIGGSSFSVVEGTGSTCGTGTAAVAGGTTAAAGYGLAANGTMNAGSGVGAIMKTATMGDNVCIFPSGTGPLAGVVSFSQQPF